MDFWLHSNPDVQTVRFEPATGDPETRTSSFDYFENGLLQFSYREPEATDSAYQETELVRDFSGNVEEVLVRGRAGTTRRLSVDYDSRAFFPKILRNGLGHEITVEFNDATGSLATAIDPNGVVSRFAYNRLGRARRTVLPTHETRTDYLFGNPSDAAEPTATAMRVLLRQLEGSNVEHPQQSVAEQLIDGFGRVVQQRATGFEGAMVYEEMTYDFASRLVQKSLPHLLNDDSQGFALYDYDRLSRLRSVVAPDGRESSTVFLTAASAQPEYAGLFSGATERYASVSIAPDARRETRIADHAGRPTRVIQSDALGQADLLDGPRSLYEYEAFGQLTVVTDPDEQQTTFGYDRIGRVISASSAAHGLRRTNYNSFDEKVRSVDARNIVTCLYHDELGRATHLTKGAPAAACPEVPSLEDTLNEWLYDGSAENNEVGKLLSATRRQAAGTDSVVETQFSYEPKAALLENTGRLVSTSIQVPGLAAPLVRSVDYDGPRVSEVRYPSADMDLSPGEGPFSVEQLYDGFGNLRELRHAGEALWTLDEAEQGFRLRAETFANGVRTDYRYQDLNAGSCTDSEACIPGALRRQSTTVEAASDLIADIRYTYNAAGQLDQRNRQMPGNVTAELFGYDAYRRLNSYVRNGLEGTEEMRGYAYTPGGDLDHVDVTTPLGATTEAYGYIDPDTSEPTHRVTAFNDRSYGYDDNGNQTRRTVGTGSSAVVQERLFDEFDMPQRIEHNEGMVPSITNFDYDAFQNRVAKRDSGQTTFYAGDAYECVGTTVEPSSAFECEEHRFKVYAGSRLIAQITQDPGGLEIERSYVHADHLGSSSLSTNENAEPESRTFLPFGETSADFTNTRLRSGFTGHEHDADIGLINMKGRLYDPELRKFISADPIVAVPLSPQSWNPYSYVMNDPLNATDPSGFQQSGGSGSGPQIGCCVVPPEGGSPIPYVITPNPPPPAPSVETRSPPSAVRGAPPPPPAPTPPPPATAPAESPPVAPPVVISLSLTAPAPPPSPRPQEHRGGDMGGSSGISGGAGHGGPSGGAGSSGYAPNVGQGSAMSGSSGARSLSWSGLVLGAATPAGAGAYRVHANPPPPSVEEGMAVASMAPGVGEAIDVYVITAPDSSFWDRVFAGASLAANTALPFLPNFGATVKGVREAAADLAAGAGRNRVSARTAGGQQVDIDLTGKGHFDKPSGQVIETPHVHEAKINVGPGGTNLSDKITRPATMQDIRTARTLLEIE